MSHTPIGRIDTARPTVTAASPLYRARAVDTGTRGEVYDVRTGGDGEITEVYALFGDGMNAREYAMTPPRWRKITDGDTVTLTHRIEHRVYRHEHEGYTSCTACPFDVVSNEWEGGRQARDWMDAHGWPVGVSDEPHGATVARTVVKLADGSESTAVISWH